MLTQADAKSRILSAWRTWVTENDIHNPTGREAMAFYSYLRNQHDHLLNFRDRGDKWQTVHSWLLSARLVSD